MKKTLKLSMFALLAAALVGCGGNNDDNGEAAAPEANEPAEVVELDWRAHEGETVTIGIWGGSDAEIATRPELFEAFYEKTGITVEERIYADFQMNLQADLIGGIAPDLFYVDSNLFPTLHADGVLANLDGRIASTPDFDLNDFYTPLLGAFQADGSTYGIPKDFSTLGLFYNIELLAEAGLTPDDIPTEMDGMPEFLAQLAEGLPAGVTPGVIAADLARHVFIFQANGTPILDEEGLAHLNDPEQLAYMQMLVDAYHAGLLATPADLSNDWSGDSFGLENVAIMIEGNWAVAHVQRNFPDVEFGVKELPTMHGQQGTMVFTVAWAINAASQNQDAAWLFMNYVNSVEGQTIMAGGASLLPSRSSVTQVLEIGNDPIMAPFAAGANYATPWQLGYNLPIINNAYGNYFPGILSGDLTLEEGMQRIMDSANNEIRTHMQ